MSQCPSENLSDSGFTTGSGLSSPESFANFMCDKSPDDRGSDDDTGFCLSRDATPKHGPLESSGESTGHQTMSAMPINQEERAKESTTEDESQSGENNSRADNAVTDKSRDAAPEHGPLESSGESTGHQTMSAMPINQEERAKEAQEPTTEDESQSCENNSRAGNAVTGRSRDMDAAPEHGPLESSGESTGHQTMPAMPINQEERAEESTKKPTAEDKTQSGENNSGADDTGQKSSKSSTMTTETNGAAGCNTDRSVSKKAEGKSKSKLCIII